MRFSAVSHVAGVISWRAISQEVISMLTLTSTTRAVTPPVRASQDRAAVLEQAWDGFLCLYEVGEGTRHERYDACLTRMADDTETLQRIEGLKVTGGQSQQGGGIYNQGALSLANCVVSGLFFK